MRPASLAALAILITGSAERAAAQLNVPSGDTLAVVQTFSAGNTPFNDPLVAVSLGIQASNTDVEPETFAVLWEGGTSGRNIFSIERTLARCPSGSPIACVSFATEVEIPLWQRGANNVVVEMSTASTAMGDRRTLAHDRLPTFQRFTQVLPSVPPHPIPIIGVGGPPEVAVITNPSATGESFSPNRVAKLALPLIPRRVQDCSLGCVDFDRDGLSDLWEAHVIELLRPQVIFEDGEELFEHPDHHVVLLGSVVPMALNLLMVSYIGTFSMDYDTDGNPFPRGHPGDTQMYAQIWKIESDGSLRWARSFSQVHIAETLDPIPTLANWWFNRQTFNASGVPVVWAEEDKHAFWPSIDRCEDDGYVDCGSEDGGTSIALSPPAFNVGDGFSSASLGKRPIVDDFDLHPVLGDLFPDEAVWSVTPGSTPNRPGKFCGGLWPLGWIASDCSPLPGSNLVNITDRAIAAGFQPTPLASDAPRLHLKHNTTVQVRDTATATLIASLF